MAEIDLEILITLVHEQPILWDKTQAAYKDRIQTRNAWIEVFKQLNDKFEEMGQEERNDYGKCVMKKWTNLRDSFQRSERKYKVSMKSGSARQPQKTYVYAQQLQFLKKAIEARATDDSLSPSLEALQPHLNEFSGNDTDGEDGLVHNYSASETVAEKVRTSTKSDQHKKKRKPDPVELELINALKQKPDRHSSFFNGIIPSLETFDDDEVVKFQLKVLQVVSDIKKRKKNALIHQATRSSNTAPSHQTRPNEIDSCQGRQYHISQPRHHGNIEGPSTSTVQYYENVNKTFLGSSSTSPHLSDISDQSSFDTLQF